MSARELREFFTPSDGEAGWAAERTRHCPGRMPTLLVLLKSCGRLGYFPDLEQVPDVITAHIRAALALAPGTPLEYGSAWSAERSRSWVRKRLGLVRDPQRVRAAAEEAMVVAAPVKAHTADLVNVALEEIVRAGLELPGFSTLDRMAAEVRTRVQGAICAGIVGRMSEAATERVAVLLEVADGKRRSAFDAMKEPGRRATWSKFRAHAERMEQLHQLGDASGWVAGVAAAKVASLAAHARVLTLGEVKDIAEPRRTAMLACLVAEARTKAWDEFVTMLCKRTASHLKRGEGPWRRWSGGRRRSPSSC
ncbi:DUF4158 domain-containing protein [Streptomyces syringium]|uniref:DUF4158 domain-containing protein n=1 Tax=Streptomyces syringium TaxID=76729 RepID=UPI00345205EE